MRLDSNFTTTLYKTFTYLLTYLLHLVNPPQIVLNQTAIQGGPKVKPLLIAYVIKTTICTISLSKISEIKKSSFYIFICLLIYLRVHF